jgi:UDP-N-acetylmuramyl tripeptide synthase
MQHAADAKHCRRCGAPYRYEAIYMGHLGRYHCDNCGATRPDPQVSAHDIVLEGVRGARFTLRTPAGARTIALPLPGLYNVYNALGAAALALALGRHPGSGRRRPARRLARLRARRDAARRGRELSILLVKNPAGANEVLRTLVLEDGEHDVFAVLNDNIADGRDVSWVWDADFEVLAPACGARRAAGPARRDGAAPEVRRRPHRPDRRRARSRAPAWIAPWAAAMAALRPAHLHRDAAPARPARRRGAGPRSFA